MRRRPRDPRAAAALASVLLALGACTDEGQPVPDPAPAPAPPEEPDGRGRDRAPAPVAEPSEPPDAVPAEQVAPEEAEPAPVSSVGVRARQSDDYPRWEDDPVRLADVRLVELARLDRVVLEFDGPVPSWQVTPVEGPVLERPGRAVLDVRGTRFLEVRLVPATSIDRSAAEPAGEGDLPTVLDSSDAAGIRVAALTGDAGDVVVFTLGLPRPRPFGVTTLEEPSRVVVDVLRGGE